MSKKLIFSFTLLLVIGCIVLSYLEHAIHPAVSFIAGVVAAVLLIVGVRGLRTAPEEETSTVTKTLYVGNLPYKANESNVRDLFAEHGEVFAVRLMKDKRTGKRRGFGFVVMTATDADGAISALNEASYMQRTLKVRVANDPKHEDSADSE